jgi:hypothetical protein
MRSADKGFWAIAAVWVAGVTVQLAIVAAVVFAAIHFIHKYW